MPIQGSRGSVSHAQVSRLTLQDSEPRHESAPALTRASLTAQCAFCGKAMNASFDTAFKHKPYSAEDASSQLFGKVAQLECRGCELVEFLPFRVRACSRMRSDRIQSTWRCKGLKGSSFEAISLEDWTDFDGASARSKTPVPGRQCSRLVCILSALTRVQSKPGSPCPSPRLRPRSAAHDRRLRPRSLLHQRDRPYSRTARSSPSSPRSLAHSSRPSRHCPHPRPRRVLALPCIGL